jgi:hypothetical protein
MSNKITDMFDNFILTYSKDKHWRSINDISFIVDEPQVDIRKYIESCDEFILNSKGEYTTRYLYRKLTPFWTKFRHAFQGEID